MRRHATIGDLITGLLGFLAGPCFATGHWIIALAWLAVGVLGGLIWDLRHEA